jgi:hypothetical protein
MLCRPPRGIILSDESLPVGIRETGTPKRDPLGAFYTPIDHVSENPQ